MKNAIGILFIGILLHYGSADVSHLAKAGKNNYLPPGNQNLPIEQDYNGIDSQENRGYLPPQSRHNNDNQGYLPPNHQDQQQDYHHHGQDNDQQQYNNNVQVSFNNNNAHDQSHEDHSNDQYDDNQDNPNNDHVEIDQQQLEPVFPSRFNHNAAPIRGEGHSISPGYQHETSVHGQSNPVESYPTHQNGYDYTPPVPQPTSELYPNQVMQSNNGGLINGYHQSQNDGVSSNQGYNGNNGNHQLNHGNSAAVGHNAGGLNQDYLPPNQINHGNSGGQPAGFSQSGNNGNHQSSHGNSAGLNQDYLPPNQINHGISGGQPDGFSQSAENNHDHSRQGQEQNYNQQYSGHSQQNNFNQDQSNQNHHSGHQEPQQDYHSQTASNNFIHQGLGVNDVDPPNPDAALSLVSHQGSEYEDEPRSRLTVRGHVNVPLPIPQVGYFFVPGVVSQVPSLNEAKPERLVPAINIPAIINSQGTHAQQQLQVPSQRLSTPEYTRSFAFHKTNNPSETKLSEFSIIPSVQTNALNMHTTVLQDIPKQQNFNQHTANLQEQQNQHASGLQDLPFYPKQQNTNHNSIDLHDLPFLPKQQNQNQQDLPFLPQQQNLNQNSADLQDLPFLPNQQNQNQHNTGRQDLPFLPQQQNLNQNSAGLQDLPFLPKQPNLNQAHDQFVPPEDHPNHGHKLQNIARSEVTKKENGIVQEVNDHDLAYNRAQDHDHEHLQHQNQGENRNSHEDYLPPNNVNNVHDNDRYESSQYHSPPPTRKGAPPPPVTTPPPTYSKPSAIRAYAPGMAYKVSTNTPYNTLTPATYLPAANDQTAQHDQQDHTAIDRRLNQKAQTNMAKVMNDNTVFPLDELLNLGGNDIGIANTMNLQRGRVRTIQITNSHANSVKNIKVLETADEAGVKTIKILGHSDVDPMGDHKVIHIVSKGSHPDGIRQTVKIFSDHEEVSLPTNNAYLPPSKTKDSYRRH